MRRTLFGLALVMIGTLGAGNGWAASSAENRAERTVLLEVTPVGVHAATLLSTPVVGLGVYLGPNWLIGVEGGSHTYTLDTGSDDGKVKGTYTNLGGSVRWFPDTNSFNLGLAVNQRKWDVDFGYTVTPVAGGPKIPVRANLTAETTVPAFIVGNQWMMDFGMVIGLDWVILSTATGSKTSGTIDPVILAGMTPADQAQAKKQLKDGGDLLNTVSGLPGVLVFSIGWAF